MGQRGVMVWRRWACIGVAGLCFAGTAGLVYTPPAGAAADVAADLGDAPAAWLEEASMQARRITGVGPQLTTALQLKGELLTEIAVMQDQLGQAEAAERNRKLVALCIRALKHSGDDGWVYAAQAKALSAVGDEAGAKAALDLIARPAEREIAELLLADQTSAMNMLSVADAQVSRGFASQLETQSLRAEIQQKARGLTHEESAKAAAAWIATSDVPALRALASIAVAEALLNPRPQTPHAATAEVEVDVTLNAAEPVAAAIPAAPEIETETETQIVADLPLETEAPQTASTETEFVTADTPNPEIIDAPSQTEPLATEELVAAPDAAAAAEIHESTPVEITEAPDAESIAGETSATNEAKPPAPSADVAVDRPATAIEGMPEAPGLIVAVPVIPAVNIETAAPSETAATPGGKVEAENETNLEEVAEPTVEADTSAQTPVIDSAEKAIKPAEETVAVEVVEPTEAAEAVPTAATEAPADETSEPAGSVESAALPMSDTPASESPTEAPATAAAEVADTPAGDEPVKQTALPAPGLIVPSLRVLADPDQVLDDAPAPGVYDVKIVTTRGPFVVRVHRDWAPAAADRFYDLSRAGFYHNQRFFRVVPGFVAQWGIHGFPKVAAAWRPQTFPDEPRIRANARGTVVFAAASTPDTRTTQVFINLNDNDYLDELGFAPFGEVIEGMDVVDQLFGGYGEAPSEKQREVQLRGNALLDTLFPELDSIVAVWVNAAD